MRRAGRFMPALVIIAMTFGVFMAKPVQANEVVVTVDGGVVDFGEQGPVIVDGRTLVPVRGVFEALGFEVNWMGDEQTAVLEAGGLRLTIGIGDNFFNLNDQRHELEVPAQLIGGSTMLPVRGLLESIGHYVSWDEETNTVAVRGLWGYVDFEHNAGALAEQIAPPVTGEYFAIMHTSLGEIHLRLFPDLAPLAVENFVTLARGGYYDGLIFHRVIDGFMIQGGCPLGTGRGGESIWGADFGTEATTNLRHIRGALSMANRGVPLSNGSQFFIVQSPRIAALDVELIELYLENQDLEVIDQFGNTVGYYFRDVWPAEFMHHYLLNGGTPHLDFLHTVFGQVFVGLDVVDAIAAVQTGAADRPVEEVVIERIEILPFD